MESKRYGREIVLRLDDREELVSAVAQACRQHGVKSARASGIGALRSARLRVLNETEDGFIFRDVEQIMEITNISGNVTRDGEDAFVHLHLSAADGEMRLLGGHVERCVIASTAEIWLIETEGGEVRRSATAEGLLRKIEFDE